MAAAMPETVSMRARDGVRLDADLYRPDGGGPFPVLVMRQPYGRQIASTICYAHPSWYADQGYIVVIQDVRGRGTSEGAFRLFADDVADGEDTIAWAAGAAGLIGRGWHVRFFVSGHEPATGSIVRSACAKSAGAGDDRLGYR